MKTFYLKILFFTLFPLLVFSQSNFSVSLNTGLVQAKKEFGNAIIARSAIDFNEFGIEAGYMYSELQPAGSKFRIYKYSVTTGYNIFSEDKKFLMSGKIGPSLLHFSGNGNSESKLGLDMGFTMSYPLFWNVLDLEMGVANTFNKGTTNFFTNFFRIEI